MYSLMKSDAVIRRFEEGIFHTFCNCTNKARCDHEIDLASMLLILDTSLKRRQFQSFLLVHDSLLKDLISSCINISIPSLAWTAKD